MSPHFYIVYFIISVKLCICYEYYENDAIAKPYLKNNPEINRNQRRNTKLRKDPNAQFDLADFLNGAEALGDSSYDYNVKSDQYSKDYSEYRSIGDNSVENIKKRDETSDFFNGEYKSQDTKMNPAEIKNSINDRQFNIARFNTNEKLVNNRDDKAVTTKLHDELSGDLSLVHHPEKKCSFKNMKFPFFSHNKSQTSKKAKKRKMFCLNCKKDETPTTTSEAYDLKNKNKRSYIEKLCPECQRKFRVEIKEDVDDGKRRLNQRMIHNSRQYFAEMDNQVKQKLAVKRFTQTEGYPSSDIAISAQNPRRKREEFEDRDRRLQELDLIQKKVDNVEIKTPRFEKPVQM